MGRDELAAAGRRRDAIFMQQGITFERRASRRVARSSDRPFPLDLVPRILPGARVGRTIKRGLAQRIRALNHFVDDVYHGREIVREGIVPVAARRQPLALRARRARHPPARRRLLPRRRLRPRARRRRHLEGARGQRPHAVGHLLRAREPRRDDAPACPQLFGALPRAPGRPLPAAAARRRCARSRPPARGRGDGRRLDAGPAQLRLLRARVPRAPDGRRARRGVRPRRARRRPATCARPRGLQRVHAIYRRLDDDFIDPLEFRPDSLLGVPGLCAPTAPGTVAIANAFGTGVADDKAIYHYVPEMIRYYLGEEPILENVRTYLLADAEQREYVLGAPATSWSSSRRASPAARACSSARRADRRGARAAWPTSCAREPGALDRAGAREALDRPDRRRRTARSRPRHVDLRPFAVFGERHPHRPRRPDARRAARGLDDRQLLAGRRLEGHLGARGRRRRDRARRRAASPSRVAAAHARPALRRLAGPASSNSSSSG